MSLPCLPLRELSQEASNATRSTSYMIYSLLKVHDVHLGHHNFKHQLGVFPSKNLRDLRRHSRYARVAVFGLASRFNLAVNPFIGTHLPFVLAMTP
jgi:hypothetical protein